MSKPRHFFRIEHKDTKIGPYRSIVKNKRTGLGQSFIDTVEETFKRGLSTSWKNCPTPAGEYTPARLWTNQNARYGFPSISKMRKWFGTAKKLYAILEEYGFVLRKYTVDNGDVFISETQCIVMIQDLKQFEELSFSVIHSKNKS